MLFRIRDSYRASDIQLERLHLVLDLREEIFLNVGPGIGGGAVRLQFDLCIQALLIGAKGYENALDFIGLVGGSLVRLQRSVKPKAPTTASIRDWR